MTIVLIDPIAISLRNLTISKTILMRFMKRMFPKKIMILMKMLMNGLWLQHSRFSMKKLLVRNLRRNSI